MQKNEQFDGKELGVLCRELELILRNKTEGEVVELGCYKGDTSVEIQKIISKWASEKRLYLYDSFEGLPEKAGEDLSPAGEQFREGQLPAGKREVVRRFKQASLPLPVIKKAWFKNLTENDIPDKIAFAFLDGDFYGSIKDSLKLIWPHLASGAKVVVDDYQNEALPGVAKAVDEWLSRQPASNRGRLKIEASLAIISRV